MPRLIWVFTGCTIILLVLSWGGSYDLVENHIGCRNSLWRMKVNGTIWTSFWLCHWTCICMYLFTWIKICPCIFFLKLYLHKWKDFTIPQLLWGGVGRRFRWSALASEFFTCKQVPDLEDRKKAIILPIICLYCCIQVFPAPESCK